MAVRTRLKHGDIVLIVCHFPATFTRVQSQMDSWRIGYEIPTERLHGNDLVDQNESQGKVLLTLSQMLVSEMDRQEVETEKRQLSILVIEKNPLGEFDEDIEVFARSAPFPAKLGYYLSFEQPLMDFCFGEHERRLLKNWAAISESVFSSALASRRIDSKIRSSFSKLDNPKQAESIEEWLKLNCETSE